MEEQKIDQLDQGLGNTLLAPKKKQDNLNTYWCFTLNNYTESEYKSLLDLGRSDNNGFCIGIEIGQKGTPHLQGFFKFPKRKRLSELKKFNNRIHWEICRGNETSNKVYCSKDGKYETNLYIPKPLNIILKENLYKWQKDILDIISVEPDDRKIYWYWETKGGIGKTTFCKYLCHHHNGIVVDGKKNDILFVASEYETNLYIFDFSRSIENFVSYDSIEKLKNGLFMNGKYEGKMCIRNSPHIIIFANFKPDIDKMSKDRWMIVNLNKTKITDQL